MAIELLIIFICSFVAFSLSAVSGGGAGLMLMPALGLNLPISQVPAALSIGTLTSSASRISIFFHHIKWKIVAWFVPAAVPAVFAGAWLLKYINPLYLEIAMGVFLVANVRSLLKKSIKQPNQSEASHALLLVIGFLAGFLSGLTGAVGLLFNRFYLRYGLTKESIVATRAANEVILHVIKLALYFSFGLITSSVIGVGIAVAIGSVLSTLFMKWGLKKIGEVLFQRIGYASMVFSGVVMLSQSASTLFTQNNAHLSFSPITRGVESKLRWQRSSFAIEFAFDEGLEYEQKIPFDKLPPAQQQIVNDQRGSFDEVIIEEVYGIGKHSYEAYFFNEGRLVKKIDMK